LCEAIGRADLTPELASITAPTLVVGGADDPAAPPALAGALAAAISGSSLTVMAAASHLVPVEQPERFSGALVDHLLGPAAARGLAVRRAVLGEAHVERSIAGATPVTAPFQAFLTRLVWGEVWTRPGLERRVRSCMTMAILVALGRFDELALHVRAARRIGVSEAEITEVLLHATAYCGAPAGNSAFAVAARVLAEEATAGEEGG
jgi:3-oxoadipate enol-lactonase/4-carboxymuconolactone decarboxylase